MWGNLLQGFRFKMCQNILYFMFYLFFFCFFLPLIPEQEMLCRQRAELMGGSHIKPLSCSSVHRVKWTLHQMQQMQNVRLRRLKSDQCQGELHMRAVPCFRLISLDHQCQQRFVYMVWSQEKKWDPGFHEQIDPLPPPCYPLTTYLWWCISGISCSLSEWADRIDVFSTWSFPHKKGKPLPPLKQHWKVLFISL